ncbi:MAG: Gfo/Idh/MocA family oxidoreductase, partial [bacterium]
MSNNLTKDNMRNTRDTLKAAIIGYGYMGEIRKRVIESHELLELVGICDPDINRREKIKGVPTFSSFDDLLGTEPDIVFVCTPNSFSPDICVKSMDLGKHVFCEKPPGRNVNDIKRIMEAENENVKLMFGFNHRFHPGIIKAKVIIDSGRLGKIISIRGIYGKSGGINYNKSWRNNKAISGGGILLDQGVHMLDLFRYFCGDFQHVKCFATNAYWNFELEDNAMVILSNDKGQNAMLHSSATQWRHTFHVTVILENGYLVVEGLLSKTGSYGREKLTVARRQFEDETEALGNPSEEITYFDRDLSWELEVDEFVKCIVQDKPVTASSS